MSEVRYNKGTTAFGRITYGSGFYAKTREECEEALAKMIAEKKAEIAAEKAKMKTA